MADTTQASSDMKRRRSSSLGREPDDVRQHKLVRSNSTTSQQHAAPRSNSHSHTTFKPGGLAERELLSVDFSAMGLDFSTRKRGSMVNWYLDCTVRNKDFKVFKVYAPGEQLPPSYRLDTPGQRTYCRSAGYLVHYLHDSDSPSAQDGYQLQKLSASSQLLLLPGQPNDPAAWLGTWGTRLGYKAQAQKTQLSGSRHHTGKDTQEAERKAKEPEEKLEEGELQPSPQKPAQKPASRRNSSSHHSEQAHHEPDKIGKSSTMAGKGRQEAGAVHGDVGKGRGSGGADRAGSDTSTHTTGQVGAAAAAPAEGSEEKQALPPRAAGRTQTPESVAVAAVTAPAAVAAGTAAVGAGQASPAPRPSKPELASLNQEATATVPVVLSQAVATQQGPGSSTADDVQTQHAVAAQAAYVRQGQPGSVQLATPGAQGSRARGTEGRQPGTVQAEACLPGGCSGGGTQRPGACATSAVAVASIPVMPAAAAAHPNSPVANAKAARGAALGSPASGGGASSLVDQVTADEAEWRGDFKVACEGLVAFALKYGAAQERARQAVVQLEQQVKQLKEEKAEQQDWLTAEIEQLKNEKDRLMREKEQLMSERDVLKSEIEGSQSGMDPSLSEKERLMSEVSRLQSEITQYKSEKEQWKGERDALVLERQQLQEQVSSASRVSAEVEQLRAQLQAAEQQLAAAQDGMRALQEQLATEQAAKQELQSLALAAGQELQQMLADVSGPRGR